jgi:hypothetical protein
MVGFSLSKAHQVAIISYEGIHLLDLQRPDDVRNDAKYPEGGDLYDPKSGKLTYSGKDYSILGLHGGSPIHKSAQGERLELDLPAEVLRVYGPKDDAVFEFAFEDLSGDWGQVTFSPDFDHIILGVPYEMYVLKRANR